MTQLRDEVGDGARDVSGAVDLNGKVRAWSPLPLGERV
jgi:hypothetical protein